MNRTRLIESSMMKVRMKESGMMRIWKDQLTNKLLFKNLEEVCVSARKCSINFFAC